MTERTLLDQFGPIDIYLFDQILRGSITPGMTIFDAGCGGGRNLIYFLGEGYQVFGNDAFPAAIAETRRQAKMLQPALPEDNFRVEPVESPSFPAAIADVMICSAVLHFAKDEAHFAAMMDAMWGLLKPGGLFFARLASNIGIESRVRVISGRTHRLPDGSDRYLVDAAYLHAHTERLGGRMVDPLKTTVVEDQRSMTTWVVRKGA
jgi:SAM-dependent methyltransferase